MDCALAKQYGFCPATSCTDRHPLFCVEANRCTDFYCCLRHTEPKCCHWSACPIISCPRRHGACAPTSSAAHFAASAATAATMASAPTTIAPGAETISHQPPLPSHPHPPPHHHHQNHCHQCHPPQHPTAHIQHQQQHQQKCTTQRSTSCAKTRGSKRSSASRNPETRDQESSPHATAQKRHTFEGGGTKKLRSQQHLEDAATDADSDGEGYSTMALDK